MVAGTATSTVLMKACPMPSGFSTSDAVQLNLTNDAAFCVSQSD
jgi:hypothetical protein